jgi:hypothetical protein
MTEDINGERETGPDFEQWLETGYRNGWVGPPVCETHDGLPLTEYEETEFESTDPCINIIRLYDSTEHKLDVEKNHSASVWRASNRGL